jgi:hypothetical protein
VKAITYSAMQIVERQGGEVPAGVHHGHPGSEDGARVETPIGEQGDDGSGSGRRAELFVIVDI